MLRLSIAALFIPILFTTSALAAPPALDCQARPAWCVAGWTCQPTACAAESAAQLDLLTAEVLNFRTAKPKRVHFDLTCGLGLASVVTQAWDLKAYPTPGACVYGVALRLGR